MFNSSEVKDFVKKSGADLAGIASMDRFEGAPKHMDPRYIFPEAKAMIVLGFRIHRGVFRGIEEGTYFSGYPSMGYGGINHIFAPTVLRRLSNFLEDRGYEAVPYPNPLYGMDANLYNTGKPSESFWSRPVSPEKPAPDVIIHFRIAAYCAGLGEIGWSKIFLTPEFGPRQRFVVCLTDAPLEPDPIYDGPQLCDRCMLCVKHCSGGAIPHISEKKTDKVTVAGREIEWGKLDLFSCRIAMNGAVKETNPFSPEDLPDKFEEFRKLRAVWGEDHDGLLKNSREFYKWEAANQPDYVKWNGFMQGPAVEGARGCIRACMVHLEERGILKNKFRNKFRKGKPWKL